MKGSVHKRCPHGTTGTPGRRACPVSHGSWSYVLDTGRDAAGKRQQVKRGGFATRTEAEDALTAVRERVRRGTYVHDENMTVGAWLDRWIEQKAADGLEPTTLRSYEGHIRLYLHPALGQLRLRDLRPGHVKAALGKVKSSPSNVHRVRATVRSALTSAQRAGLIETNPATNIDMPKVRRYKPRPWQPAELPDFLDRAAKVERLGAAFEVALFAGLRRGELVALRWEDLDATAKTVTVERKISTVKRGAENACPTCGEVHNRMYFGRPKTASGEARVVNLDDATAGTLLAHRLAQDVERKQWGPAYLEHDLVFPKEDGTPLHPDSLSGVFEGLRAGLRHTRLHDLRHGQASLMLASGADMVLVSKRMGHSSVSTTADLYSHLVGNVGKESAEKSRALVQRAPSPDARDQSVTSRASGTESVGQPKDIRAGQERA